MGFDKIIGCFIINLEEMVKAIVEGVDYIGVGFVYVIFIKVGKKFVGLEYV